MTCVFFSSHIQLACGPGIDGETLKTVADFIFGGLQNNCNGTPLQYSCLENPMDGGAWKAAVYWVAEGRTRLSYFTFTFHSHALEKPGESQGRGSLKGCRLWGRTESDTTEAT